MNRRWLLSLLVVVSVAVALWELRIVAPADAPQSVGLLNADPYTIYYPLYSFFYQGQEFMPAWNPYQMAGTPTVGYLAGGLYYPPNLLHALLPVHRAMSVVAALHIALAGVGTLLLARDLGLSKTAALIAAVGFLSNHFFITEHVRPQYLEGLSWIPLAALGLRRLVVAPGLPSIVGAALVLALQLMTGDAQVVCYEAYFAAVAALAAYVLGGPRSYTRHALQVMLAAGVAVILAAGLAAAQLLPTLEVVAQAVRGYGGLTVAQTMPLRPTWGLFVTALASSGTIVLLAGAGVLVARSERPVLLVTALIGGLALAIGCGTVLYTRAFYHLPGVDLFRLPQQTLVIAGLALSLMAGFGVDALRRRGSWLARALVLAGVLVLAYFVRVPLGLGWIAALIGASAFVVVAAHRDRAVLAAALLVLGIVVAERFAHTSNTLMIPSANDAAFFRPPPVVEFLRANVGFDRVLVIKNWRDRFPLMEKFGSLHGISVVQDFEPLTPRAYHRFLAELEPMNPDKPLFWGRFVAPPMDVGWRALDLMSTSYVVADPKVGWVPRFAPRFRLVYEDADAAVYQNTHALPRAQLVSTYRVIPDQAEAVRTLLDPSFDARREVILDRHPDPVRTNGPFDSPATATVVSLTPTKVVVQTSAPRRAFLLLNDLYWPGWTASIDGTPVSVYRANGIFRAIDVPEGAHRVVFSYAGGLLRAGIAISLVTLASCVALLVWRRVAVHRL